jgi:hypothetical protein
MDVDIDLTYAVASSGAQITFTQNTVIADLEYYKLYITDGCGNEAYDEIDVTATTTPVVVDTSGLDASKDWCVKVIVSMGASQPNCTCENTYNFEIGTPSSDPTDTITTADVVGALSVAVNGATVADGGTAALGAASVDDVVTATIAITNTTADSLVTIPSGGITGSGDGSFSQTGFTPVIIDNSITYSEFVVTMDTATIGAKTFSLVVTSDDAASPYNVDITLTVS